VVVKLVGGIGQSRVLAEYRFDPVRNQMRFVD
jgi:hypothetical protein